MTNRTLLTGTLAGILSGISYFSTSSLAKEPSVQPSPTPSAYSLEDIATLQEKMRDVCVRGGRYLKHIGRIEFEKDIVANFSEQSDEELRDPNYVGDPYYKIVRSFSSFI
ncbi:MAG: hypothetical protein AABX52_00920, partial [Nanoarchaeota archaeon]